MTEQTFELLPDGTPLTDEVVDKLVADVYTALDNGAYHSIPNPHGKIPIRKINNPKLCKKLKKIVSSM